MSLSSANLYVLASSVGICSHLVYFIRGEHHKQALLFLQLLLVYLASSVLLGSYFYQSTTKDAVKSTASTVAAYLAGLWASMLVYRIFFHRLNRFPGPRLAKISKFYHFFCLRKLDNHRRKLDWHNTYGNFVRIGPGELSIRSPNAPTTILGPGSKCLKAPFYDYVVNQPLESLHSTRDFTVHEARRRVWDRGFSMKALRDYEPRLMRYTYELIDRLAGFSGQAVDATAWLHYYSFDVMGDLALGHSFEMLKSGNMHFAIKLLADGTTPMGAMIPIMWLFPILINIPGAATPVRTFIKWCNEQIDKRREMKLDLPDITSWLLKPLENAKDIEKELKWLHGDARLIIVAGSDTVAATMTHIFYYLAKDQSQIARLRSELEPILQTSSQFDVTNVRNANHLNGVINEALRLHPPIGSGVFRKTPPEGVTVDGTFIPGEVNVSVPDYAIGRSDQCYDRPDEFIPERWYSRPEMIKSRNAFAPFSLGPFGCIGKQLALMELRTVVSLVITRFDVHLAPSEDGTDLLENTKDTFTMRPGKLRLVFDERHGGSHDVPS